MLNGSIGSVSHQQDASEALACVVRLTLAVERLHTKQLFPYDARPLLHRLDTVEQALALHS